MGAESYAHILVPLDGSKLARSALEGVLPLARAMRADLTLVTVIDPVLARNFQSFASAESVSVFEAVESYLTREQARLLEDGFVSSFVAIPASGFTVAERLAEIAIDNGADMIAMSTHGRTGLGKAVFGSVAAAMLAASPVPILVFPQH